MRSENRGRHSNPDSLGEEVAVINICISNGSLKCHRVLISTTPIFEGKVICWYTGFSFQTFILQNRSIVVLPFLDGFPVTVQQCQSYSQFHNCNYLSRMWLRAFARFLILPEELQLGVANQTAIIQDWAHQSFISCLFYLLGTKIKI